jgi:molybdate transport system substrate-binding protein
MPLRDLLLSLLLPVLLYGPGCKPDAEARSGLPATGEDTTLYVFAAASLADAFAEIERGFEARQPGVDVVLNLAGSQQLAQQLRLGAPADVFASANPQQLAAVVEAGRIEAGAQEVMARNRLVVVFPRDNPAGIGRLEDLARPGLRLVLADEAVPVGRYTRLFLDRASRDSAFGPGYGAGVRARVVSYEQSVRAVLAKVLLGEADAGVVYLTDLAGPAEQEAGSLEIPDALNLEASYPIAPVVDSGHPVLARRFISYVLSSEGQAILSRYGFVSASPS